MGMRMHMDYVDMETIPQFQMMPFSLSSAIQNSVVDIFLLVTFNLLFFTGAYVGFLRYDVR